MTTTPTLSRHRLLVIEDDLDTVEYIRKYFKKSMPEVEILHEANENKETKIYNDFDCLIIDRVLPQNDGINILKKIRLLGIKTPAILLTQMDGIQDRVKGLKTGADDYVVKPFSVQELSIRIENILQRARNYAVGTRLVFSDLEINLLTREAYRAGKKIYIQAQELKILECFMRNPRMIISRDMLLQNIWGIDFPIRTNLIDSHISRLRERLGRDLPNLIHTIKGKGYILEKY
nr:response regulator transcription factor [uncultured Neokomagataea sp.]